MGRVLWDQDGQWFLPTFVLVVSSLLLFLEGIFGRVGTFVYPSGTTHPTLDRCRPLIRIINHVRTVCPKRLFLK